MGWTTPEPWSCDVCPAEGYGGRAAKDHHNATRHMPVVTPPAPARGPVVPEHLNACDVRAWARANGWPNIGSRGRIPQAAIDGYEAAHQRREVRSNELVLEQFEETRDYHRGDTAVAAHRLGMTVQALEKALHRARAKGIHVEFHRWGAA